MSGVPQLGFGCASLGSRKSEREGLAALHRAYAAGVRWFDVAPSYGDGAAEQVLGRFLRESGGDAAVCTKVGIAAGRVSLAKRLARPVARTLLTLAPKLRETVRRLRPSAQKQPITGALVSQSIDESLRRLGVDQVAVLALHDAASDEVARDDVLQALEAVRTSGKARSIGIASSPDAVRAALTASDLFDHVQFAHNPYAPGYAAVVEALGERQVRLVTHSVFGNPDISARLAAQIALDRSLQSAMAAAGYAGSPEAMARAFLPDFAFSAKTTDIVLMSMFSADNLAFNVAQRARAAEIDRAAITAIAGRIAG